LSKPVKELKDDELVAELEKWVAENPEAADAKTINITTGKEFTLRQILNELKQEQASGKAIADEQVLQVKTQIKKWLGEQ